MRGREMTIQRVGAGIRSWVLTTLTLLAAGSAMATGQLREVSGDVSVATGTAPASPARKDQLVPKDSIITTGAKSQAVLKFPDGQVIALKSNSTFQLQDYRYDEKEPGVASSVMSLLRGGFRAVTGLLGKQRPSAVKFLVPQATIGIRGTDFMVELVNPALVQVIEGGVTAVNGGGPLAINAGQTGMINSATTAGNLISASSLPPGTFNELLNIPIPPATPEALTGTLGGGGISTGAAVGLGAAVAGAAALGGGSGDSTSSHSTTSHH